MISCRRGALAISWLWSGVCCNSINRICPRCGSSSSLRSKHPCRTIRRRRGTLLSATTQAPHITSLKENQWRSQNQMKEFSTEFRDWWQLFDHFTFCGWFQQATPGGRSGDETSGWGSSKTGNTVQARWEPWTSPVIWTWPAAARQPCCQGRLPTWSRIHIQTQVIVMAGSSWE